MPPAKGNRAWLRNSARVRSPHLDGEYWRLPRASLTRLITAAVDRFGWVALCREVAALSACTRACLEAVGADRSCVCLGEHHGHDSGGWYEKAGDLVVDIGRSVVADHPDAVAVAVVAPPDGGVVESEEREQVAAQVHGPVVRVAAQEVHAAVLAAPHDHPHRPTTHTSDTLCSASRRTTGRWKMISTSAEPPTHRNPIPTDQRIASAALIEVGHDHPSPHDPAVAGSSGPQRSEARVDQSRRHCPAPCLVG
jgi:hypothetical protein